MENNIEVLDSSWLRDSKLYRYVLENGDTILLTNREYDDLLTGDLVSVQSNRKKKYAPIFSEHAYIIGFNCLGDSKNKINNLEDLKDYAKHLQSYARSASIYINKNKKEYLDSIEFNGDEMVKYMKEELSEWDDDEVVIEILYPSGEPVFYHESEMQLINEYLEKW